MDWGNILETVLTAVITVAAPFLIKALFDWLKLQQGEAERWAGQELTDVMRRAVVIAVRAAEQSGLADIIGEAYEGKKDFAIAIAERYLVSIGVEFDLDVIADMIEAEVLRQFPKRIETTN